MQDNLHSLEAAVRRWEETVLKPALLQHPLRRAALNTISGLPIRESYTPLDIEPFGYLPGIGFPGSFPYTRGIEPTMYRSDLWIMGQYSGFGTPEETNKRFKELIARGQTGFSIALDLPTQLGYDSDHVLARGEVGRVGVALNSLRDMDALLDGIPLDKVRQIRTSANAIGPIMAALFICFAEENGIDIKNLRVLIQNDVLKEYVARGTQIIPPRPATKLAADVVSYCATRLPHWQPLMVCGAHFREAGGNAVQELAFAFADAIAYFEEIRKQAAVDDFAPGIWMFFNGHSHLFEEAAKFRAARRMWARLLSERFGAQKPDSLKLKLLCYTGGSTLTTQQPMNNIVRVAFNALAGVLGGVQTLATSSWDEGLDIPSSESATLALRTQQILAHETGVADVVDPLGGSYFVEALTNKLEEEATKYMARIAAMGGAVSAIEQGYMQGEIARSAYAYQCQIEKGERKILGVNEQVSSDSPPIARFTRDPRAGVRQVECLERLRVERDAGRVGNALADLESAARAGLNVMPATIQAVRSLATVGEIAGVYRAVFGSYSSSRSPF